MILDWCLHDSPLWVFFDFPLCDPQLRLKMKNAIHIILYFPIKYISVSHMKWNQGWPSAPLWAINYHYITIIIIQSYSRITLAFWRTWTFSTPGKYTSTSSAMWSNEFYMSETEIQRWNKNKRLMSKSTERRQKMTIGANLWCISSSIQSILVTATILRNLKFVSSNRCSL